MKTVLFGLCFLSATAALAQSGGGSALNAEPQMLVFPSHAQHASPRPMGHAQDLREASGSSFAQGERPLWEVAPVSQAVLPLGDAARALRKEHAAAKKAEIIWNN
jgi:hypothetical protein